MNTVYVRWYGQIVQGQVVSRNDLLGLVSVTIPIQGVQVIALFHPHHVYNTQQEAGCTVGVDLAKEETDKTVVTVQQVQPSGDWQVLQQFKADHWDHEHNRLQIDYWEEFYHLFRDYMAKRLGMMRPQQHNNNIEIERPLTDKEAMNIIPSTDNPDTTAFINEWVESKEQVIPRTIGKPYTVTELTLF